MAGISDGAVREHCQRLSSKERLVFMFYHEQIQKASLYTLNSVSKHYVCLFSHPIKVCWHGFFFCRLLAHHIIQKSEIGLWKETFAHPWTRTWDIWTFKNKTKNNKYMKCYTILVHIGMWLIGSQTIMLISGSLESLNNNLASKIVSSMDVTDQAVCQKSSTDTHHAM